MGNRLLVVAVLLGASVAHADEVDDLVAKGQELAKQSEFTQAIAVFKQADAKRPRAAHACMIGLAYMRREAWPQAELFLALCEKRAVPGDQPPDWIDEAKQQLAQKLSAAQIPAVTIEVSPANIGAQLTVSSFAPDEIFDPQTIHLAAGDHVIKVTAPGFVSQQKEVSIEPAHPLDVTFALVRDATSATPPPTPTAPAKASRSKAPWIVGGIGVGIGVIGGIYHIAALAPARTLAADAESAPAQDHYIDDFHTKRTITLGLYAGAALTLGLAVVLHVTLDSSSPQVSARVDDHGAAVLVGWRR